MKRSPLHKYTFVRLVIPWITGVFCGDYFFNRDLCGAYFFNGSLLSGVDPFLKAGPFFNGEQALFWNLLLFGLFGLFLVLTFVSCFLEHHAWHPHRWWFGVSLSGLCLMGGWIGMTWQLGQTVYHFPKEETVYRVLLMEKPERKEHSFLCRVMLVDGVLEDGVLEDGVKGPIRKECAIRNSPINRQAILYLSPDSSAAQLQGGEELLISALISPPANSGNWDEFDYARYLLRKDVSGTGYVATGKWRLLSGVDGYRQHTMAPWQRVAACYRSKIIDLYRRLGFGGDELAVLSALTVGDKTELSESVRESYSVSGASHVLALSGLHIGLLYAFLFFLMKPLTLRWRLGGRCLRSLLLLSLLWAFAFFTGLSPSVVRSVCMFSLLALAELFGGRSFSLNVLAATAFFMLLFRPVWLFDVGFQLSFLAVAAILLMQQPIYLLFPIRNRVGKYIWGLMSVSIAAQLGVAPLVLLYFSRFSTHFLLTNLVVIPLVTTILYLAVVMLLLSPLVWLQAGVAWLQESIAWLLNYLLRALNGFVHGVERLPFSSIDGINLYRIEVCGLYFCLFGFLYYLLLFHPSIYKERSVYLSDKQYFASRISPGRFLLVCLIGAFVLCSFRLSMLWINRPQRSWVFYNVRHCPVVHCLESDGRSWLVYGDALPDKKQLRRVASNYWQHRGLHLPAEVAFNADYQSEHLRVNHQILSFGNSRICMISDNRWANKTSTHPLAVNYLYVCGAYQGTVEQLTQLFLFPSVVLDASLPEYQSRRLSNECRKLNVTCHSLSAEGALCLPLSNVEGECRIAFGKK